MGGAKKDAKPQATLKKALVFAFRRRGAIGALVVVALFTFGGWRVWNHVRDDVLARPEYTLAAHLIQITPPPDWIRADVKTEALRDGSLDGMLSVMDEQLSEQLARAFRLHPWVASVQSVVRHYPGRVTVELVYRSPAAMVEVPGGLYPVDAEGVLLPSADFSVAEVRKYPRVGGIETQPLGPVGSNWGDRAVTGAAKVAQALRDVWHEWRLYCIRRLPARVGHVAEAEAEYELITEDGTTIHWGHAPGNEAAGELPAAEKRSRLAAYRSKHGDLDEAGRRGAIDLTR
jgi:hypothetical protein